MTRPPTHAATRGPVRRAAATGSVRIVGGRWRGTRLDVCDVDGLRPTSDRARETLFNWLQPVLAGARVLDLFAGSGALALESLSRGAREALMVERDVRAMEALQGVVERLDAGDIARVVRADAAAFLRAPLHGQFDIVFVDPPFAGDAWQACFDALDAWVAPGALLYVESPPAARVEPGAGWTLHREMRSREARHALYRRTAGATVTLDRDPAGA